jgi:PPOX class probable F420-dependent enzyme
MPGADLGRERYLSLATFRRDGTEVRTPIWCAPVAGKLYVVTSGESGKVKRLRRSPRARVAPCNVRGTVRGPWQDATARLVGERPLIERAHAALRAKYGWQMRLLDAVSRASGRIRRRAWIEVAVSATPAGHHSGD